MKLKTKLLITFLIIVFVPLSLIGFAFWLLKMVAFYSGASLGLQIDPHMLEDLETEMGMLVAPNFMMCMIVAIIIILIVTALALVLWIYSSVFNPIRELNIAMKNIADGNLDCQMPKQEQKGELGELSVNYQEMRLRL